MLRDIYYTEDSYQEEANCRVMESYDEEVGQGQTARSYVKSATLGL